MNVQIGADEQALLAALLRPYLEGRELRVFGSRARATAKPWSDLDLLLIGAPLSLDERAALMEALRESALPYAVELQEDYRLDPVFRARILPGSQRFELPAVGA